MDGPTATKAIRALGYTQPIIGCTGNTLDMDVLRLKEAGCNEVLGKPFRMDRFVEIMGAFKASQVAALLTGSADEYPCVPRSPITPIL